MARINSHNKITGALGTVVFRSLNQQQILQTRNRNIQQTLATQKSAKEFRQCSTWAKCLRQNLDSFLAGMTDSYIHGRLTGAVYAALRHNTAAPPGTRMPWNSDMSGLVGFEMNTNSPWATHFLPEIVVVPTPGGEVAVHCDGFVARDSVVFPTGVVRAELLLYVLTTDWVQPMPVATQHWSIPIALGEVVPAIDWVPAPVPSTGLTIVTAKLLYYHNNALTGKTYCTTKQMSPAQLLAVVQGE
jgi:hypothetical protein